MASPLTEQLLGYQISFQMEGMILSPESSHANLPCKHYKFSFYMGSCGVHYLVLSSAMPEHFPAGPLNSYHVPFTQEVCQCRSCELHLLMFLGSANLFERISSVEPEEPLVRIICWVFL